MAVKAIGTSHKVSVRTDMEGVLSMNFMVEVEGENVFVEFRVWIYCEVINDRLFRMWITKRIVKGTLSDNDKEIHLRFMHKYPEMFISFPTLYIYVREGT
jgi:Repair protein Rad1/Rec1/Rad17